MFLDRKKMFLISAAIVAVALVVVMVIAGVVRSNSLNEEPTTPPTGIVPPPPPQNTPDPVPSGYFDPINPIAQEPAENQYPATDLGYQPLGNNFDPNVNSLTDTVYQLEWAQQTQQRLYCELATKPIATARAIKDLKNFLYDLKMVATPETIIMSTNAENVISDYESYIGEAVPERALNVIRYFCDPPEESTE